ncbi:MAG: PQQ-binding-like beta-propeller repeat protein, partial [Acidobacteria bacterium]|nr:PQQ-binding-like beta-propeller repeat protein [Acidobacteriota bacterium]
MPAQAGRRRSPNPRTAHSTKGRRRSARGRRIAHPRLTRWRPMAAPAHTIRIRRSPRIAWRVVMQMPSPARIVLVLLVVGIAGATLAPAGSTVTHAQSEADFVPVTDVMLQDPPASEWLMWRRTLDGWGYSPLDQIDRSNVGELRMVWSRAMTEGRQQGTPLVYDGVMYMPNPADVIQAIDAVSGDLRWEYRREVPEDIGDYVFNTLWQNNRNLAIYGSYIIDTSADDHIFALDATTGRLAWETRILDYQENPATQTSGPIVADGKAISGRSCMPAAGPNGCVITAHDPDTGEELWRRRTIPAPGEPGDESWGGVPFEERKHVGAWMVPSYDPELNLVYIGTSVTSPAPKFLIGGTDLQHLYHNSTLALDADTGEIAWYYQHMNDHWDLDHPFERLLVDTAVAPDADAVEWINPRLNPGEIRKVMTGIPGKTGVVYTLDRETGEFLWARPTITQNVISGIDGATGAVTENPELIFTAEGQEMLTCPHATGGKDWEAGAYSPLTNMMY